MGHGELWRQPDAGFRAEDQPIVGDSAKISPPPGSSEEVGLHLSRMRRRLGLATLLYSFLEPTFPFRSGLETFGTTLFGIAIGTAVIEVTATPHTGCDLFMERFGKDAGRGG